MGGLAENTNPFGGLLGTTFNYVFETQLTDLQNGDRFYYLARTPGMNLRAQLEGNSFAELMMRNTTALSLKADPFATADCKFQFANAPGIASAPTGTPAAVTASTTVTAISARPSCRVKYPITSTPASLGSSAIGQCVRAAPGASRVSVSGSDAGDDVFDVSSAGVVRVMVAPAGGTGTSSGAPSSSTARSHQRAKAASPASP
eukprot:gene35813-58821_t